MDALVELILDGDNIREFVEGFSETSVLVDGGGVGVSQAEKQYTEGIWATEFHRRLATGGSGSLSRSRWRRKYS